MSEQTQRTRTAGRRHFRIESPANGPDLMRLALLASPGLARVQRLREAARRLTDPYAIATLALRGLEVSLDLPAADEERIPQSGPLVVTANHPFGALDGLAAIAAIGRRRRDLRILANPELAAMEGIGSLMIAVDPFGGGRARRANSSGLRQALRWLQGGGALLMFPAGEVSNLDLRVLAVLDRPWSATAARLIRLSRVPVVPMHFAGANSALFQLAGVLHPHLRTLLLPHELGNKVGSRVQIRTGEPVAAAKLAACGDDDALAAQLRIKTYLLGSASAAGGGGSDPHTSSRCPPEPLIPAIDPALLAREIESLPPRMRLASSGRMQVYCAASARIPWILQELGRLRELTFRAVGEGTGRSADIDVYDNYYEHLFIWNSETREIVGAYRVCRVDEICRRFGKRGLYTSTLFEYNDIFLTFLGPALELGRSFVRTEHQKSFAALMLLWKGIGEYVGRHPHYCRLIGPVSISNAYRPLSRELMVGFLRRRNFDPLAPALVRPKQPFRSRLSLGSLGGGHALTDIEALSALVADLEPDNKGAPILLRQYLKLGGRMLGFNVDPQFSNALDCLVLVDLRKTPPRVLRKYMSDTAWQRFAGRHRRVRAAA